MRITEVVRGADLLKSTARQILLYRALGFTIPNFYHCDLVRDECGVRLAKRHDSLSIRKLRELGWTFDGKGWRGERRAVAWLQKLAPALVVTEIRS